MPAPRSLAAAVRGLAPPAAGPSDADLGGRFAAGRDEFRSFPLHASGEGGDGFSNHLSAMTVPSSAHFFPITP
jgi:hypothetical protein